MFLHTLPGFRFPLVYPWCIYASHNARTGRPCERQILTLVNEGNIEPQPSEGCRPCASSPVTTCKLLLGGACMEKLAVGPVGR